MNSLHSNIPSAVLQTVASVLLDQAWELEALYDRLVDESFPREAAEQLLGQMHREGWIDPQQRRIAGSTASAAAGPSVGALWFIQSTPKLRAWYIDQQAPGNAPPDVG